MEEKKTNVTTKEGLGEGKVPEELGAVRGVGVAVGEAAVGCGARLGLGAEREVVRVAVEEAVPVAKVLQRGEEVPLRARLEAVEVRGGVRLREHGAHARDAVHDGVADARGRLLLADEQHRAAVQQPHDTKHAKAHTRTLIILPLCIGTNRENHTL